MNWPASGRRGSAGRTSEVCEGGGERRVRAARPRERQGARRRRRGLRGGRAAAREACGGGFVRCTGAQGRAGGVPGGPLCRTCRCRPGPRARAPGRAAPRAPAARGAPRVSRTLCRRAPRDAPHGRARAPGESYLGRRELFRAERVISGAHLRGHVLLRHGVGGAVRRARAGARAGQHADALAREERCAAPEDDLGSKEGGYGRATGRGNSREGGVTARVTGLRQMQRAPAPSAPPSEATAAPQGTSPCALVSCAQRELW